MDFNRLQPKDVARKYRKKFSACGASLAFPFGEGEPIRDGETPCPFALQILVAVDEVPISPPLFSQIPLYLFHFWEKYGIMSRYREKRGKEGQRHGSF